MAAGQASGTATVIVVPVLGRPHRVAPLIEAFTAATPEPHRLLFVASPRDYPEMRALTDAGAVEYDPDADPVPPAEWTTIRQPPRTGDYARKVNHAYRSTTEPYLFTGADDLEPQRGWLTAALRTMSARRAIGVVGTQDGGNPRVIRGEHATHFLVARWYVDEHGTIDEARKVMCELYPHEYVDDEFIGTARHRNAYAFAEAACVTHRHPNWFADVDPDGTDVLYAAIPGRQAVGKRIFRRRKHLWGGIDTVRAPIPRRNTRRAQASVGRAK